MGGFEIWSGGISVSSDLGVMNIKQRRLMSYAYHLGEKLSFGGDYSKLCEAPKGTLLYTPSGKIVERGAPDTTTYYGNAGENHYYEHDGVYVIVGLGKDEIGELAKELWEVRNEALIGTRWEWDVHSTLDEEDEGYNAVYRALAAHVLAR